MRGLDGPDLGLAAPVLRAETLAGVVGDRQRVPAALVRLPTPWRQRGETPAGVVDVAASQGNPIKAVPDQTAAGVILNNLAQPFGGSASGLNISRGPRPR